MIQSWMQETPRFSTMYHVRAQPEKQRTTDILEERDPK